MQGLRRSLIGSRGTKSGRAREQRVRVMNDVFTPPSLENIVITMSKARGLPIGVKDLGEGLISVSPTASTLTLKKD